MQDGIILYPVGLLLWFNSVGNEHVSFVLSSGRIPVG